jgi:hypothetical protein
MLVYINFVHVVMNCDTLSVRQIRMANFADTTRIYVRQTTLAKEILGATVKRDEKFQRRRETRRHSKQQQET